MRTFDAIDDCPHQPDTDPAFQESALFSWHDLQQGIGGFWRIGQEPVAGTLNSSFGVFTTGGLRFRSNVVGVPMGPADRGATHMGWGSALRVDLDTLSIRADFPDCAAVLTFEDFFPRYYWADLAGQPPSGRYSRGHFAVAGRLTGKVRLGRETREIDALGYRDRSWGPRRWGGIRATRWWPAVFGPDLCAHAVAVVDENGLDRRAGYVMRDGEPHAMTDVDVTATLEYDAITPRSAQAGFRLDNGRDGELIHEPSDGIVLHVRGYTAIESIGTARWGDRVGMSLFEISTNPAGGTKPPVLTLGANSTDGLSWRHGKESPS